MSSVSFKNDMAHETAASQSSDDAERYSKSEAPDAPPTGGHPPKVSIFAPEFAEERKWMWKYLLRTILIVGVGIMAILPIYWGSYFQREKRVGNLKAYVYNMDKLDDGSPGLVGETLVNVLPPNSLGWEIQKDVNVSWADIERKVHDEHAWIAVVVAPNATQDLYNAMRSGNTSFNNTGLLTYVYERERDLLTFSTIQPQLMKLEAVFQAASAKAIYDPLLSNLTSNERSNLINNASQIITNPLQFAQVDLSQYEVQLLIAVLQVGLIYLIIIAFFQFNFFMELHQRIGPKVDIKSNILYRIVLALISYLFISLFVCLVSLAFQIKMSGTFGKSGFLVFWMINYITMIAVGQATENMAMLLVPIYPPAIGFWLLFWVITNISPAFSALELTPAFYKYGYAFPIFNALQAQRVVLVNTTKKHMGTNIGVLLAWVVVDFLFLPICLKFFGTRMAAKAIAQKKALVEEVKQQLAKKDEKPAESA